MYVKVGGLRRATNTGVGIAQFIKLRDERIIID